jgi:pimeloyl-ACP methyl ester carboxylesterase
LTGALAPLAVWLPAEAETRPPALIAQAATYPTTEIPCPEALPPGEIEGETITCGILTVPENYDEPEGRQIELTYAVLHSQSLAPAPDPIMDLRGGPGGSVLTAGPMEVRANVYESLRRTRDVILLDQRGTKYSNQLGCASTRFVLTQALEGILSQEAFDEVVFGLIDRFQPTFPEASQRDVFSYAYEAVCAELLAAHGVDLNQYNTPNNAQDVVNLTTTLGYDEINLYGISYGTYLAQQIMRDHPDRVRSTVLDSTLPQHVRKYDFVPRDSEVTFLNLIEDCQADAACAAAYPDLKQRAIALLNTLSATPVPLDNPVTHPNPANPAMIDSVTADAFAGVVELLNSKPRSLPQYLPLMVHELEQGMTTTFVGVASGDLLAPEEPTFIPGTPEAILVEAEDLQVAAEELLRAEAAIAQTQRPASLWVERVRSQIVTLPEAGQLREMGNLFGIGYQTGRPRDRNTLLAYVDETFDGEVAQSLAADVNALSEVEVRHVYEVVSALMESITPVDKLLTVGMYRNLECRETVAFSDRAATEAVINDLEMPQLAVGKINNIISLYNICEIWPVEPAPASEYTLLNSDIPTLILQGRYDTQTNAEMGRRASEGLSNSRYVEVSSSGHGVIFHSDCAKDIGVAFVNNPEGEVNMSCTADLLPEFVLPSE